jgi:hypothetical protein
VVERVDRACPGLIQQDHAFTDAVATLLEREDPRWGRNGKRGNPNDPSHDAIAWRMPSGPGGVAILDIIAAAGSPEARPAWQDVTQATIDAGTVGAWVAPSGVLPACLSGGPVPPLPGEPPMPMPPDFTETLAEIRSTQAVQSALLAGLRERLTALEVAHDAHAVDTKERTDVIRVTLEQLDAWLRGRRILRY